jgi:hypothetical protein
MGRLGLWGERLALSAMLNLEGVTLERGELNAGIWGEGYVDRRHPHTYLHEAMAELRLPVGTGRGLSLAAGKGFAPFGTDDPMARPFVKYPANHHLAQVLERAVAIAALRAGPLVLEGGAFNGDEPGATDAFVRLDRFADSWSTRLTLLPRYALLEWARTDDYNLDRRGFSFRTLLGEAALDRRGGRLALRYERTQRPEEERLADPFRSPRPHADVHIQGITRWDIATLGASQRWEPAAGFGVRPFLEVAWLRATAEQRGALFVPEEFYGSDRMWSLSLGARLEAGTTHRRMGRYGAALPAGHAH